MNLSRNDILLSLIAAAALALASCSRLPLYSHFEAVDTEGWDRTDTLHFSIPVQQAGNYAVRLDLRANSLYPYTQLTLFARQQTFRQHSLHTDSLVFDITDTDGNIRGNGTSVYQYHALLPAATLQPNDTLHVSLYHGMARDILPGIIDLGITVKPATANR